MAEEAPPPPPMAVMTFEEAFERYVIRGTEETEGYFLLMAWILHRTRTLTTSQRDMLKKHYDKEPWLKKVDGLYNVKRFRNDLEPLDINIFNILNGLLGGGWLESEKRWVWESQDAYNVMTMMYHIMVKGRRGWGWLYEDFEESYKRITVRPRPVVGVRETVPDVRDFALVEDDVPPPPPAKRARVDVPDVRVRDSDVAENDVPPPPPAKRKRARVE